MEEDFQQRLVLALAGQASHAASVTNIDMVETTLDGSSDFKQKGNTIIVRMGTRKNPKDFGKNLPNKIRNQSEMSYENENSMNKGPRF